MRCEICGTELSEGGITVEVDGARLLVCMKCRKFGEEIKKAPGKPSVSPLKQVTKVPAKASRPTKPRPLREKPARLEVSEYDLVEDYPQQIRRARELSKLTQGELAQRIGERLSIVQKLETGKIRPSDTLIDKLDRVLRITLKAPVEEDLETRHYQKPGQDLTIGEVAKRVERKRDD